MKLLQAILTKAQKHKGLLLIVGILLVPIIAVPRLARHLLKPTRSAPPRDGDTSSTHARQRMVNDTPPASLDSPSSTTPVVSQVTRQSPILLTARNHKGALLAAVVILTLILTVVLFYKSRHSKTPYYIAYIGRYKLEGFDPLHELALRRYIDELNEKLEGVRLELKIFDTRVDKNNNDSRIAYEEIARDKKKYVAVIDNTWGKYLQPRAKLIRDNGIPVISINADKRGEDYGQNVLFIGYDDKVPEKVINFNNKILVNPKTTNPKIIFIGEDDFPSTSKFREEFEAPSQKGVELFVCTEKVDEHEKLLLFNDLDRAIAKRNPKLKLTIILNTHAGWGDKIIEHINCMKFEGIDIVGGPFITNLKSDKVNLNQNDRLIIFTYPYDAVTNKLRHDVENIEIELPEASKMLNVRLYVKRCRDAVTLISAVFGDHPAKRKTIYLEDNDAVKDGLTQRTTISREDFTNFFRDKLANNSLPTDDELYSFDQDLLLLDDRTFEQYSNGEVSSYPKQLNSSNDEISNIHFGLDNINISGIDTINGTFHADFLYWLKYDVREKDVKKYILFGNQKNEVVPDEELVSAKNPADPRGHRLFKRSGDFSMDLNLARYPFDIQEAKIEIEIIYPVDELHISFDHASFERSNKKPVELSNEWIKYKPYVTVDNLISTALGGASSSESRKLQKFKVLNVRTLVSKDKKGAMVTIILPLIIIGVAAIALLFVNDGSFSSIGEVCVVIFLSIVTYSIAFAQIIPKSNVLTIADKIFFLTLMFVFLIFLKVIFFNSSLISDRTRSWVGDRAILIGSVVLLSYFAAMIIIVVFTFTHTTPVSLASS